MIEVILLLPVGAVRRAFHKEAVRDSPVTDVHLISWTGFSAASFIRTKGYVIAPHLLHRPSCKKRFHLFFNLFCNITFLIHSAFVVFLSSFMNRLYAKPRKSNLFLCANPVIIAKRTGRICTIHFGHSLHRPSTLSDTVHSFAGFIFVCVVATVSYTPS